MSLKYERMADDSLAAWLSGDASRFRDLCTLVVDQLGAVVVEELLDVEQSYVDVKLNGHLITLHSEAQVGVAVMATSTDTEATVREVAEKVTSAWSAR